MGTRNQLIPLEVNEMTEEINAGMDEEMSPQVSDDDKLWAALAYVFTPLIPIILLLMEDKKDRPFIKAHNVQALAWGVVLWALTFVLSFVFIGICLGFAGFFLQLYWGYKAYQGEYIQIPVITDFVKNQGWA
jgi:uncharacterized membrane protein